MRWHIIFMLAGLGDCLGTGSSTGTSGGGSTTTTTTGTGGASSCTTASTCDDCKTCALDGPCAALFTTCEANSDCQAIDQCASFCGGDATCLADCYTNNPDGSTDYQNVNQCVFCKQCPTQCPGQCSL